MKIKVYWAHPYSRWGAEPWQGLYRIFLGHLWIIIGPRATFHRDFVRTARIGRRLFQLDRRYRVVRR